MVLALVLFVDKAKKKKFFLKAVGRERQESGRGFQWEQVPGGEGPSEAQGTGAEGTPESSGRPGTPSPPRPGRSLDRLPPLLFPRRPHTSLAGRTGHSSASPCETGLGSQDTPRQGGLDQWGQKDRTGTDISHWIQCRESQPRTPMP